MPVNLPQRKIGVFDSGIGGLSVAQAVQQTIPDAQVIFMNDAEHIPYGLRDIEEIFYFTLPILRHMVEEGCQVIVIACNTVTTNLIGRLRKEMPVPLVGLEPMVKPAALATKTGVISVCATPRTLSSKRYKWLKSEYARGIKVLEPDCSRWAFMIESNRVDRQEIASVVEDSIAKGADQIVLGCTHYHWIEQQIKELASGHAEVLQPEQAVMAQLNRVLAALPDPARTNL